MKRTANAMKPKRVVFLTGTRADFGKIKSLIRTLREVPEHFSVHIFATGMHMEPRYGYTVEEIEKCGFDNIYRFINQSAQGVMDRTLAHTILGFGDYVRLLKPDLIVVHGDRVEALAGATVGALQNVLVAHVEGGEVSGTVDELIRHAVSKLSHLHFVANEKAQNRLLQLGEQPGAISVIGSPDVDTMFSPDLPTLDQARDHYQIPFAHFSLLVFHPVTTELKSLRYEVRELLAAARKSGENFIAVYPNSDAGSSIILEEYETLLQDKPWVRVFPSLRFEFMLSLLKHARFIVGNSSMGIREAPYYGIPTINIGSRQDGRGANPDILHVPACQEKILHAMEQALALRSRLAPVQEYGDGKSHLRFRQVLLELDTEKESVQKRFRDRRLANTGAFAA